MSRQMKAQSNWRGELSEYAGVLSGYNNYGDLDQQHAKTETKSRKEIKEKDIKNKIVINPVVKEAFEEIGAVVLDIHEEAVVEELSKEDIEELQRKKDAKDGKKPGKVDEDNKWIQKATKNMRKDKPCTGDKFGSDTCPPGSKRYNLAKTFKKMAKNEAYYGGEEQRQKDEKKEKIDTFMDKAMPKRTFDQMGRETDRRTGKLKEDAMLENDQVATLNVRRAMVNAKLAKAEAKAAKNAKKQAQRDPANEMAVEEIVHENEDSLRDRRMERGGVDGNVDYSRPPKNTNSEWGKKKPSGKSAIDMVKAQIRAKHGKGAIYDPKK